VPRYEVAITYDEQVPDAIIGYTPPEAKEVHYTSDIDPELEAWRLHLAVLAKRYEDHPLPQTMELIPRSESKAMRMAIPGSLPGIDSHWIMPLASSYPSIKYTLGDFLMNQAFSAGLAGLLRVPKEFSKIELNHDLVTKNDHTWRERVEFVLREFGLELVESVEPRKVWVAHYDGRELKPHKEVPSPMAYELGQPHRPGTGTAGNPASMADLFEGFNYWQDQDLTALSRYIVDETGLAQRPKEYNPEKVSGWAVCDFNIYWGGNESIEIARKWFAEQFGVTFADEERPLTIYEVRKKPIQ
jgi:hypothetical protein